MCKVDTTYTVHEFQSTNKFVSTEQHYMYKNKIYNDVEVAFEFSVI